MNGTQRYSDQFTIKINALLQDNKDKDYLEGLYYSMINLEPTTIYNYLQYIIGFHDYTKKPVSELAIIDYTRYLNSIHSNSQSYQIAVYSGLRKLSSYLFANEICKTDLMSFVPRPKFFEQINTKQKREMGFLSQSEIKILLSEVEKSNNTNKIRDKAIILVLLNTGMRCSALYKLDIDNYNKEEHKLITIDKRNKIQEYNLSQNVENAIDLWIKERSKHSALLDKNALFISQKGSRLDQSSIARMIKKYSSSIKGKNISPHKLRATYGTQLYNATKDIYFVQQCMRHTNPKTTELYIRGQVDVNRKKAAEIMSNITK